MSSAVDLRKFLARKCLITVILFSILLVSCGSVKTHVFRAKGMSASFSYSDEFEITEIRESDNCDFVVEDLRAEFCQYLKFGKEEQEIWYVTIYLYPIDVLSSSDDLTEFIIQGLQSQFGAENVNQVGKITQMSDENGDNFIILNVKQEDAQDPWGSRQIAIHIIQDKDYIAIMLAETLWYQDSENINSFIQTVGESFVFDR